MQDIEKIYEEYFETVNKYLFCLTHNNDISEELTQETFYKAVKKINTYKGECKMSVWLCQIAKNLWYDQCRKNKKNIDLEMDEDLTLPYYGNEELLQQVWLNLLNNAIKFTSKNGRIEISGDSTEEGIIVSISDNGIGMDKKTMERIFDKYYQNDSSSVATGSGIGLAIVKRIVTLCGGNIQVASKINEGSTFTVNLPV